MTAKRLITITLLVSLIFISANIDTGTSFAADPPPAELDENNADIAILQWVDPEGRQPMTYEKFRHSLPPQQPMAIEQTYATPPVPPEIGVPSASLVSVIVNSSLQASIQDSIDQYVLDLENEGYSVTVYATSGGTPNDLRAYLQGQLSNGLVGCLLVGDLPVPWYEMDDDFDGYAQFPIDLFYMDLDGTWTDSDTDGLYDGHSEGGGDRYPDIWVGRVTADTLSGNVTALLQNYFEKNHAYRTGGIILNDRALVYVDDDWFSYADTWDANVGLSYDTRTLVKDGATTNATDYKNRLEDNYEWIQLCAHSSAFSHSFKIGSEWTGGSVSFNDIKSIDPVTLFYNLFACSACRYVENNYIGGWYIFANTYGLATVGSTKTGSMLQFDEFYTPIGQYKSLGESFKEWFIAVGPYDLNDRQWYYGMTLLGDPTLSLLESTWTSYSDAQHNTRCDLFTDYDNEHTVYMYGTRLLPSHDYRVAYYDGSDTKKVTDDVTSGASGNVSSQHTFVQGTDVAGTWNVIVCEPDFTPPTSYNGSWSYTITSDNLTVLQSAIPEFPTVIAAIVAFGLCVGVYIWMRRKQTFNRWSSG